MFFLEFIKTSKLKHLIKILHHLYIYTEFCSFCQVLLTIGGFNSLTNSHLALTKASPLPGVFAEVPR